MKKSILLIVAACAGGALLWAAVPGFVLWNNAELHGYMAKIAAKMKTEKVLGQDLGKWGNHWSSITRRNGDGVGELHEKVTDLFICEGGEATLVVGGTLTSPTSAGAGEMRGTGITGGRKVTMKPGDMVEIPANMPHQLLVPKEFLYYVVKVQQAAPQSPEGFRYWSKADFLSWKGKLQAKLAGKNVANQEIANWGNHSQLMVYRTGDGEVEIHEKQVDYFIVQQGEATLTVGGKATGTRVTGPGEQRGGTIAGGEKVTLKAGDIAHVPAAVPHQVVGTKDFLYAVLKVTVE
ncbi:hypothetical protein [Paludibaculum fermentans]|uniref:Cupin 2 conserved barrel domain-containing protein n=1 Tax=Paludibaculum fermentans TaxID=1473598 RepID=A0A7S7NSR0_PALFE|nr:hypothetical protein [Paludibaculum fermentans]QOY89055.1 hypothetical protein IRI77_03605 [Paludibaculum fermentans]